MFLEIPISRWSEKKGAYENDVVFINPFHVVAIERDPEDAKGCRLILLGDLEYWVRHTRNRLKKIVDDFVKENVLSKIYKEMKDQQN